ncbi:GDSL family lipase [Ottowia sp. GY511]|uniref:SGNH/GDSL hydrolase family protein n=1 Tax=Ottowia flava TaxID=2675430 RepID=A0ABW4KSS7_9BURK|nr:SGNH/GDSL hydrolase family protein [Ottowia sp. GY511]TXK33093.1 GDSL family lipase [Ottowia sp. GY511]
MKASWTRRATLALATAGAATLLAACGDGSVVSDLKPTRFITVGDSFADVGQTGSKFTVNDGTNNWVQELAAHYNQTVAPASAGGWGYAQGYARVEAPDTSSGTNTPSVSQQIDTLLARTPMQDGDVMMLNGGMHDIVAAVEANGISDATTQAVQAAGKAMAAQVRRVVNAGATHVVVTGVQNMGLTPWALRRGEKDAIERLSYAFNDQLLINIADMGATVLYFDAALFFNLINNKPDGYSIDNEKDPACTTPDASTCTPSTIVPNADYNRYMYADLLNFSPKVQRNFVSRDYSENVYDKFKNRW